MQKITNKKNSGGKIFNGSLLCICLACDREVANEPCGHRVKQPTYST